jgi:Uma2 family endonuclease
MTELWVVVAFEVVSPTSDRTDRIEKLREYQAVRSILRYVILEHTSVGLTVHARLKGDDPWTARPLIEGDVLRMQEIGIEIPVEAFYEGTDLLAARDAEPVSPTPVSPSTL